MYSFYGGKEGRTYNLVAHYDSIYKMVEDFHKGAGSVNAKYNEYVIIDTIINKNEKHNRENGIIYRRGVNYTQDFDPNHILDGDASHSLTEDDLTANAVTLRGNDGEWIDDEHIPETAPLETNVSVPRYRHYEYCLTQVPGQDVQVELHAKELKVNEKGETLFNIDWKNFVTEPGGGAVYVGQIVGPQGESPLTQLVDWETFEEQYLHGKNTEPVKDELIASRTAGFDGSNYNDDIKYGYCNVRDNQDNVTGVVLSMDLPYTVFNFNMESVSAYGPTVQVVSSVDELPIPPDIEVYYQIEGKKDDFYVWDETRRIQTVVEEVEELPAAAEANDSILYYITAQNQYYRFNSTTTEFEETTYSDTINQPGYVLTEIWAVDNTDPNAANWKYTNLLREYADSQGHNFYKNFNVKIPKGIHGTSFEGIDKLNRGNEFEVVYYWKDFEDANAGEGGTTHRESLGKLRVIKDTNLIQTETNSQGQEINVSYIQISYYDGGEDDRVPIKRLGNIDLDANGHLQVVYVNGGGSSNPEGEQDQAGTKEPIVLNTLRWITHTSLDSAKRIVITYNTFKKNALDGKETSEHETDILPQQLKVVDQIGIENDNDLAGRKTFYYQYDVGELDGEILNPPVHIPMSNSFALNEIVATQLIGDNIAVLYSDSASRLAAYRSGSYYKLPYEGNLWNVTTPDVTEGENKLFYWANLGPSLGGEHIFGHFNRLSDLQDAYPNGFGSDPKSKGREGWVATVAIEEDDQPGIGLYAYDYTKAPSSENWYEISHIIQNQIEPPTIMMLDKSNSAGTMPESSAKASALLKDGYWFVTETKPVASDL